MVAPGSGSYAVTLVVTWMLNHGRTCATHVIHTIPHAKQGVVKPSVSQQLISLNRYTVTSYGGDEEGQVVIDNACGLEELPLGALIGSGECLWGS